MLELLGLDTPTEAVYRAMLERPQDDVTALARHVDLAEDAVRAAWDKLSQLSLIQPSAAPTQPPRAVSPELGLDYLLARRQAEFALHRQRMAAARTAASQLISEYADRRPAAGNSPVSMEHLADVAQIRARLSVLTDTVRQEVMAFSPGGAQTEENMASARPLNKELLGRGVKMRTIYLESFRNCAASVAHANWLTTLGGQVRTAGTLPLRMTILDRETAVIPLNSEDSSEGAVVITGKGTLTALCTLFETVWEASRPLGEKPCRDESELDRQEAAALRLLAEGHTDEGIAKRLGVSHRTARRIATALMDRLGARSRFEAGVRAVQRGWLPHNL
ncbi:helix-turn-helix domain-containing protein [Streptomyces sp. ISL-96]|uniref:helix-turn-helix transcriptional regulator n=1 Tax=Streptomyces sp. ISL-96 TaxID=2819191 RepID=UPI001BE9DEB9|nr:LuxR C-terminal-related transcriptional regulator [Streptomyces sp. ISL-96]MBT2489136.1 helix-turn-helix domain-containing protein [Streptomyces sp. ISL-96]